MLKKLKIKNRNMKDSNKKSMLKSLVWRIIGVFWLAGITWIFTHSWIAVGLITVIHHGIFLVVFYLHERMWIKIVSKFKAMRERNKLRFGLKAITYEIILGNVILGIITYFITGDVKQMTAITITYIQSKLVLYFFYDWMWTRTKRVVYAYVVADIFHIGHLKALENAREQGDHLIVGVLTDRATMEKKHKPIISFNERIEIIKSIGCVDEVVPQERYSPLENIKKIKPDILMESSSHEEMPANDFVKEYGGKVVITEYYVRQSSTKIKDKVKEF